MDQLTALLDGPRARSAFLLRTIMSPPWCLRIEDEAPLTVIALVQGQATIVPDSGEAEHLSPGDVAVARGPHHYRIADAPGTPPKIVVHPGQRCTTLTGEDMREAMHLGVRTWGNDLDGPTVMLIGAYETDTQIARRLVETLPPVIVERAPWETPLVDLLALEIVRDVPGQQAVLDRLLDLLVVALLRRWFARSDGNPSTWYQAHGDDVIGPALRLIHNAPAHPWSVANLAEAVAVSRATLARRFKDLVGEPPMNYLTTWRMTLAADLLLGPEAAVGAVARAVGYDNPFTFSTAFKRVHGVSPKAFRDADREATPRPAPSAQQEP